MKERLIAILGDIASNPRDNPTLSRAQKIMNSIYEKKMKDANLHNYNYEEDAESKNV